MNIKNHLAFFEYSDFLIILAFFIVPPLFVPFSAQKPPVFSYSLAGIVLNCLVIIFCLAATNQNKLPINKDTRSWHFFQDALFAVAILCALFATAALLSLFAKIIPHTSALLTIEKPANSEAFVKLAAITALFACYEELVYRRYFPTRLQNVCQKLFAIDENKTIMLFCEVIPLIFFALAHRYLGVFPVINAFIAGILLRLAATKTGIASACIIHTLYNITMLI